MEMIENGCFYGSGIEEITLPGTVKEVGDGAFNDCNHLRVVWVEEGSTLNIRKCVDDNVVIFPAGTMVGDKPLRDLRR